MTDGESYCQSVFDSTSFLLKGSRVKNLFKSMFLRDKMFFYDVALSSSWCWVFKIDTV